MTLEYYSTFNDEVALYQNLKKKIINISREKVCGYMQLERQDLQCCINCIELQIYIEVERIVHRDFFSKSY